MQKTKLEDDGQEAKSLGESAAEMPSISRTIRKTNSHSLFITSHPLHLAGFSIGLIGVFLF
jgi:hypothetical protein